MGNYRSYCQKVLFSSFNQTWNFVKTQIKIESATPIGVALFSWVILKYTNWFPIIGDKPAINGSEISVALVCGLGGLVTLILVVFIFELAAAPYKLYQELETILDCLKSENLVLQEKIESHENESNIPDTGIKIGLPAVLEYLQSHNYFEKDQEKILLELRKQASEGNLHVWAVRPISKQSGEIIFDNLPVKIFKELFVVMAFRLPQDAQTESAIAWGATMDIMTERPNAPKYHKIPASGEIYALSTDEVSYQCPVFLKSRIESLYPAKSQGSQSST